MVTDLQGKSAPLRSGTEEGGAKIRPTESCFLEQISARLIETEKRLIGRLERLMAINDAGIGGEPRQGLHEEEVEQDLGGWAGDIQVAVIRANRIINRIDEELDRLNRLVR